MSKNNSKGISLIELIIALTLIALVASLGFPALNALIQKNRLDNLSHDLKAALQFARLQAVLRGEKLCLSPLHDWSNGMHLCVDNPKHRCQKRGILYQWRWFYHGFQIDWRGFLSKNYLLFSPDMGSNTLNGVFYLRNQQAEKKLVINRLGRVY
jgi:type IV fimbrial biogenesis protein FimT